MNHVDSAKLLSEHGGDILITASEETPVVVRGRSKSEIDGAHLLVKNDSNPQIRVFQSALSRNASKRAATLDYDQLKET